MKSSPKIIGFLQAAGLTLYITVFAFFVSKTQSLKPDPVISIITFLLAFVISALICGSLVFAYPVLLFFNGKHKESVRVILWSLVWLIVIGFFVVAIGLLFLQPRF